MRSSPPVRSASIRVVGVARTVAAVMACAALATLAACGAGGARYVLPAAGTEAGGYYPAIMTAAQEKGAQAYAFDDHVQVRLPGDGGWVFFFGGPQRPAMEMIVQVPDKVPAEVPARKQAAKDFGDALWNRALELRRATLPGPFFAPG
jgi:predicted small lipoprotein YifL